MFLPECFRFFRPHNKKRRRKSICQRAILTDNGYRNKAVFRRITGSWVNDMMIQFTVFRKIPLISAGSDDRFVFHIQNTEIILGISGVFQSHPPKAAI